MAPDAADEEREQRAEEGEERTLYLLIAAIGAIPVAITLWQGGVLGPEATIGLGMMFAGIIGLLAVWRGSRHARMRP
ncbi:MAG: hypothetical protein KF773_02890 [Deltaproteobacteria bacterium]|nr:hypothetical protein [Deltaproteobacteria bacterium]MCW5805350.1 hypothetical protein [Deltaproteobacteria bacterium]